MKRYDAKKTRIKMGLKTVKGVHLIFGGGAFEKLGITYVQRCEEKMDSNLSVVTKCKYNTNTAMDSI